MHTMPENLNDSGIEVFKRQTAYPRCTCGNGYNLEYTKHAAIARNNLEPGGHELVEDPFGGVTKSLVVELTRGISGELNHQ